MVNLSGSGIFFFPRGNPIAMSVLRAADPMSVSRLFVLAVIVLAALPQSSAGSTPPISPAVTLQVTDRTIQPGSVIMLNAEWSAIAVPYPVPPDHLAISVFNIADGSLITTYRIEEVTGEPQKSDTFRHYQGTISSADLPAGALMLVATDPISGAESRVPVQVQESGDRFPAILHQRFIETVFFNSSLVVIIAMAAILLFLIRVPGAWRGY
jgi:hypothetical protein